MTAYADGVDIVSRFLTSDGTDDPLKADASQDHSVTPGEYTAGPDANRQWLVTQLDLVISAATIFVTNWGATATNGLRWRVKRDATFIRNLDGGVAASFPFEAMQGGWEVVFYDTAVATKVMHLRYRLPEPLLLVGASSDVVEMTITDNLAAITGLYCMIRGRQVS